MTSGSDKNPKAIQRISVDLESLSMRATSPVLHVVRVGCESMHTVLVYQYLECNQNPHLELKVAEILWLL
jgi:fructosamine-3-kinase